MSNLSSGEMYCGKLFFLSKKKYNHIYEACESTCQKCSAKDKVENDKEDSVVEDADFFMKEDLKKKNNER